MKTAALITATACMALLHCVCASPLYTEEDELNFKAWMSEHNKKYSPDEYYKRLQIFTENKRRIDQHNAGNHTYTMGLNQFADLTHAEFKKMYLMPERQVQSAIEQG